MIVCSYKCSLRQRRHGGGPTARKKKKQKRQKLVVEDKFLCDKGINTLPGGGTLAYAVAGDGVVVPLAEAENPAFIEPQFELFDNTGGAGDGVVVLLAVAEELP